MMGIFISIIVILLASWRLASHITPEQDKKNMDDAWWLLTGQEPVDWSKK